MTMKKPHFLSLLCCICITAYPQISVSAEAGAYAANDLLLFFQNPDGITGTDQVVYFNLGSTRNVFRNAATPGSADYGSTIYLGNIAGILSSTYGDDWSNLSDTMFFAANGQAGSTGPTATGTSSGDFARTVYITKARSSLGIVGQPNSPSPLFDPSQTQLAGNIAGANTISGMTQPGVANAPQDAPAPRTLLAPYNPFFNGMPSTAYGVITGGLMGSITSSSYTFGSVSNVVGAIDLYRVAQTSGTGTANISIWQNANNIPATYVGNFIGVEASGYYLGAITLSDNGDVNFVAAFDQPPVTDDYTVWAEGYPDADLTDKQGDYDKDGFKNVDEYAFGTNPTLGNTALSSATVVSNNLTVGFFRRSTANDQAPAYSVFSSTDLANVFTNNGASISILTNVAPAGYQAASVTQLVSGSKIFYRIKATLPQDN
jgi:hypothetical protein